jgi:hypothetical protein
MPEFLEVTGPTGPVVVEVSDAALTQHGRAGAIDQAVAALAPAPTKTKTARGAGE